MLARTARYIARELGYEADREEVLHFGLQVVTNFLSGLILLSVVGSLLGTPWTTLFAALVAGTIKIFAGGAHASSSRNCVVITTLYFAPAGWAAARWGPGLPPGAAALLSAFAAGAALWAIWRYAPAEPPEKPLLSRAHREQMRVASFLSLAFWVAALAALGVAAWWPPAGHETLRALFAAGMEGLAWQALILTPAGYRLTDLGDGILNLPRRRGKEVKSG